MKIGISLFFCFFFGLSIFSQSNKPKIIVGLVVDQMCYDYLYSFQDKFIESGFRKIMNNGTNCRNTNYNYVPTYTGPGHASIYTGTTPDNHGIVGNEWYERESKEKLCPKSGIILYHVVDSVDGLNCRQFVFL